MVNELDPDPDDGRSTELALNPRIPKYYRVKRQFLELTAKLAPGSPVPPERELAEQYTTSRTTVRQALGELVAEGRLLRVQGKGTFVAAPKVAQSLQLTSYTEDMHAQGLTPQTRTLELGYVAAEATLAERLGIKTRARVLRIHRLRLADDDPMAIETTHLAAGRFPGLRRRLDQYSSLYETLATVYGVHLAEAEETIETVLASPVDGQLLGVDVGVPLLALERHSFDADGIPVEFVRSLYRGDRYKFVTRIRRP